MPSILTQNLSKFYSDLVHVKGQSNYPLLDRFISYALPTLATLTIAQAEKGQDYNGIFGKAHSQWGLPASFAFYAITQIGLTEGKLAVEKMSGGRVKSTYEFGLKILDTLNNVVPYATVAQVLPDAYATRSVYAFKILPAIVAEAEKDLKAYMGGTKYESAVAGSIYAAGLAGLVAKNIGRDISDKYTTLGKKATPDSMLIKVAVEGVLYAVTQKALRGQNYKVKDFEKDLLAGIAEEVIYDSSLKDRIKHSFGPQDNSFFGKNSTFAQIPLVTTVELAKLFLSEASQSLAALELEEETASGEFDYSNVT